MALKDITKLKEDISNNNPNDFLLNLSDEDLLVELYYSKEPEYSKSSEQIRNKYPNFDEWKASFAPSTRSEKDRRKEKELKESSFNTQGVKNISDAYKSTNLSNIMGERSSFYKSLQLLRAATFPKNFDKPSILEGVAGDTQNVVGTGLNFLTLGKAKGPIGQTVADLGTLTKEIVIGSDKLETVRKATPGKSKEEFKSTRVKSQETTAGNVVRGIAGYAVPFTGALKGVKAATQATKFGQKLLETRPLATGAVQFYGATATVDQLVMKPEEAFTGKILGTMIGEDRELLQATLKYVSASPDKTEGENRVAVLFDSIFVAGAIKGVMVIGGGVYRSGKELFNYFKGVKENGTPEQTKQLLKIIEDASNNNPKAKKKSETIRDTIEEQEVKLNKKIADGTSWQFSENSFKRGASNLFNVMTTSRGLQTPKMFAALNLNKNAAIAYQNLGVQLKTQIDNTVKKLVKSGKYTEDNLNKIIESYLTKPDKNINKLIQTLFTPKEYKAFVKEQKKIKFTTEDLPIELKELVDESRKHINDLSKVLLGSKYVTTELKKEIADGYGSYLRKSYLKFSNPNYKPSKEVFDEAIVFISKQLRKAPANKDKNYTDKQFENMATAEVDNILRTAKYSDDFFNFIDNVKGSKDGKVIFAERQKIAKEIENLLGVETQASSRIFNSLADVSQFISRQQTLHDFSQLGKGKYFFEKAGLGGKQFNTQLKGKEFGPLNEMWTTPEMASNFIKPLAQRQGYTASALKFIYSAKGFAQASKTVGNNITHERNLQSSGIIMLSNGLNPFDPKTFKAVQVAWSAVKPTDKKAINDLYNDYLRLGVANQNAKLGDIKRLISESQKNVSGTYLDTLASKTGLKYLARQVEKAYVAEDDIWKIAVYESELAILKKAYPKEVLENLKVEAARITRNTMPTYDMIPSGFKVLRYSPFGNYFAFHAERFRNTFHSYKQAVDEIKSGNEVLKQRGYRRLGAQVSVGQTGTLVVSSSSMYHTGVSKEEDTHIKNIFKQSYNGSNFLYDIQNDSGKLLYADPKYTDPSSPVNDVLLNPVFDYLNTDKMTQPEFEDKFYKAATTSAINFVSPFIDSTILFTAVMDIFSRDGKTVGPDGELFSLEGWDDTTVTPETKFNNFLVGLNHVTKAAFLPVFVDNIANTIEINKGQADKYGVTKDKDLNKFKNLAGLNYKPIDKDNVLKRVSQESKGFNAKTSDVRRTTLNKYVGENNVTISKLKHQYLLANRNHYLNFTAFKKTVNSAIILQDMNPDRYAYTKDDVIQTLKEANLSEQYRNSLTFSTESDTFIPLSFSEESIDKIIKMNPSINRSQLEDQLRDLKYELMDLPLLDMREDYSEEQIDAVNTLYERSGFVEGGKVSKDYPVSDALITPADRKNPATGEPFSGKTNIEEQLIKLGLK